MWDEALRFELQQFHGGSEKYLLTKLLLLDNRKGLNLDIELKNIEQNYILLPYKYHR